MAKKENKYTNISNNVQLLFFISAIILFYFLLKPLLNIFLASIILTYVFYPVYKRIKIPLRYENLSISITLILIIIIFLVPFVFVASQIPKQTSNIYNYVNVNIVEQGLFDFSSVKPMFDFIGEQEFLNFDEIIDVTFKKITQIATYIVIRIPNIIIGIVLALFISFFLFKDGKKLVNNIAEMIPLNKKYSNKLIGKFGDVTYSVVFAHIIAAIVQGTLGAIGFYLFGIPSALFWGVVMAIFALLPLIGPAIVWLPAAAFVVINGVITNSYVIMGKGIGLFLYGTFIISTIDHFVRLKVIGSRTDVHPLTILVGIIGGINLFGLVGIFVGPIILSLLVTFFRDFSGKYV